MKQVLVFTRTKREANRLARELKRDGFEAREIHSDRTQAERMDALAAFKEGGVNILVATDIAARGIDIEDLPFVVNYELPYVSEDYVHRIGRTGRAGTPGEAISLVSPDEMRYLADIEKILKKKIERRTVPAGSQPAEPHGGRAHHPATPPAVAPRPRPHTPAKMAASPSATAPANGDFDFTKPYEPSVPASTASTGTADVHPLRAAVPSRRPARQTPALLGGLAKKA
jgi:superfamily II DNA/RNA helicase